MGTFLTSEAISPQKSPKYAITMNLKIEHPTQEYFYCLTHSVKEGIGKRGIKVYLEEKIILEERE